MGFLMRAAGGKFDIETLVTLYNAYVKSNIEFGISIWYPHPHTSIGRDYVEGIQNRFTRPALKEWANKQNYFKIRPYDV